VTVQQGCLVYKRSGHVVDTRQEPSARLVHAGSAPAKLALRGRSPAGTPGEMSRAASAHSVGSDVTPSSSSLADAGAGAGAAADAAAAAAAAAAGAAAEEVAAATDEAAAVNLKPCKWIYVLDTSGRLYVHAKYRGKFHHSSFVQGGAVLAAGGIVVEQVGGAPRAGSQPRQLWPAGPTAG